MGDRVVTMYILYQCRHGVWRSERALVCWDRTCPAKRFTDVVRTFPAPLCINYNSGSLPVCSSLLVDMRDHMSLNIGPISEHVFISSVAEASRNSPVMASWPHGIQLWPGLCSHCTFLGSYFWKECTFWAGAMFGMVTHCDGDGCHRLKDYDILDSKVRELIVFLPRDFSVTYLGMRLNKIRCYYLGYNLSRWSHQLHVHDESPSIGVGEESDWLSPAFQSTYQRWRLMSRYIALTDQ